MKDRKTIDCSSGLSVKLSDPKANSMQTIVPPSQRNEEDRLMDLDEVAEKLGHISTRSVRRLIARGELPQPVKVLSSPRLYHSDVVGFLDRLKQKRNRC